MNKKLMTMLVACALSVTTLSTTAVFAEDAVVTGETPAVTETTTTPETTLTPTPTPTPTPETTPAAYEPEVTLLTPKSKWTGDSDIVFEVDAKGGTVSDGEMYVYDANGYGEPLYCVESTKEVNEQGKGKITFTKDALMNAETWTWNDDDEVENKTTVDWTKYSKIEFVFGFKLNDQYKYSSIDVESSVKAPEITVTPTTPAQPSTPAKPAENKGTTTTTTTATTTKKEAPKTGDTMNVALYASLLLVSALAAVVLTTKKRITE